MVLLGQISKWIRMQSHFGLRTDPEKQRIRIVFLSGSAVYSLATTRI
jgi:hypothetical protein